MKKREQSSILVLFLFVVYLVLLVWIILFKLQFSIHETDRIRSINLIPFYYEKETGLTFHAKEIFENAVIFVPLGIYLCILPRASSVKRKFIFILSVSLLLELSQYILAAGRTDVTDLITNTCGGMAGVGLYWLAVRIFPEKAKVKRIITVFAAAVTIAVIGLFAVLLMAN